MFDIINIIIFQVKRIFISIHFNINIRISVIFTVCFISEQIFNGVREIFNFGGVRGLKSLGTTTLDDIHAGQAENLAFAPPPL